MGDPKATERAVYPLRDLVLFPGQQETIRDMRALGAEAVSRASAEGALLLCVTQTDPRAENPTLAELFPVGTLARIVAGQVGAGGYHSVTLEGVQRADVSGLRRDGGCILAVGTPVVTRGPAPDAGLMEEVMTLARRCRERLPRFFPKDATLPVGLADAEVALDRIAALVGDEYARPPRKMKVLEKADASDRALVLKHLFLELLRPGSSF